MPLGLGLAMMDHAVPFHDSTSVTASLPLEANPTAVQDEALRQVMPDSWLDVLRVGLGLGMIDQSVPFHDSTRVPAEDSPTAVQLTSETHEIAFNTTPVAPVGLGLGMIDQWVPFHDSTRVCEGLGDSIG